MELAIVVYIMIYLVYGDDIMSEDEFKFAG